MTGPSRRHLKNRMECQQALTACASIDQRAAIHVAGGELVAVPRQSRGPLQPQDLIHINASQRANGKIFAAQSDSFHLKPPLGPESRSILPAA